VHRLPMVLNFYTGSA